MSSLQVTLAINMTKKDNGRLCLQELEALDEKRIQAQQCIELYQARISKAFNKKVKERVFQKWRLDFCHQTIHGHDTQNQRQISTQMGRAVRNRNSLLKWGL